MGTDADVFCLQETKLSDGQLSLELPGYRLYWNYADKKGYSGTAVFVKEEPVSVTYGVGVPELDTEGRMITLEYPNFYLVTCYTPNAQRELARIDHRLNWDEAFRARLTELDANKPVIVCGDLNVAHKEIDIIAKKGSTVAFVEVKTALDSKELPPMLRVGSAKRANMAYAAKYFAANYRQKAVYYRFDIIEVILSEHKIRHIENAFTI